MPLVDPKIKTNHTLTVPTNGNPNGNPYMTNYDIFIVFLILFLLLPNRSSPLVSSLSPKPPPPPCATTAYLRSLPLSRPVISKVLPRLGPLNTSVVPAVEYLRGLYGEEELPALLERNPELLLTKGIGEDDKAKEEGRGCSEPSIQPFFFCGFCCFLLTLSCGALAGLVSDPLSLPLSPLLLPHLTR